MKENKKMHSSVEDAIDSAIEKFEDGWDVSGYFEVVHRIEEDDYYFIDVATSNMAIESGVHEVVGRFPAPDESFDVDDETERDERIAAYRDFIFEIMYERIN